MMIYLPAGDATFTLPCYYLLDTHIPHCLFCYLTCHAWEISPCDTHIPFPPFTCCATSPVTAFLPRGAILTFLLGSFLSYALACPTFTHSCLYLYVSSFHMPATPTFCWPLPTHTPRCLPAFAVIRTHAMLLPCPETLPCRVWVTFTSLFYPSPFFLHAYLRFTFLRLRSLPRTHLPYHYHLLYLRAWFVPPFTYGLPALLVLVCYHSLFPTRTHTTPPSTGAILGCRSRMLSCIADLCTCRGFPTPHVPVVVCSTTYAYTYTHLPPTITCCCCLPLPAFCTQFTVVEFDLLLIYVTPQLPFVALRLRYTPHSSPPPLLLLITVILVVVDYLQCWLLIVDCWYIIYWSSTLLVVLICWLPIVPFCHSLPLFSTCYEWKVLLLIFLLLLFLFLPAILHGEYHIPATPCLCLLLHCSTYYCLFLYVVLTTTWLPYTTTLPTQWLKIPTPTPLPPRWSQVLWPPPEIWIASPSYDDAIVTHTCSEGKFTFYFWKFYLFSVVLTLPFIPTCYWLEEENFTYRFSVLSHVVITLFCIIDDTLLYLFLLHSLVYCVVIRYSLLPIVVVDTCQWW